jgi:heme-binding NEAT domain protein
MNTPIRLAALIAALAPMTATLAADREYRDDTRTADAAVDTLEANLRGKINFQVDSVHVTDHGIACIQYHTANSNRGDSPGQAVVDGEKVLTASPGNRRFEKAWNKHCAD